MKFQYVSDLHLEFRENKEYFKNNPIKPVADVLLIAGDLGTIQCYQMENMIKYFSDNWKYTIIVPGNHEYYGGYDILKLENKTFIKDNVILLNNDKFIIDNNYQILGSTLWSNILENERNNIIKALNDFYYINFNNNRFNYVDYISLHKECYKFLKHHTHMMYFVGRQHKTIILTHHAPLLELAKSPPHQDSKIASAFGTDCLDLLTGNVDVWVYGHTHTNADKEVNGIKILSNNFGYAEYNEHIENKFNPEKYFEL